MKSQHAQHSSPGAETCVTLCHGQITQELREYAQKHQLDEEEAAQVRPVPCSVSSVHWA